MVNWQERVGTTDELVYRAYARRAEFDTVLMLVTTCSYQLQNHESDLQDEDTPHTYNYYSISYDIAGSINEPAPRSIEVRDGSGMHEVQVELWIDPLA